MERRHSRGLTSARPRYLLFAAPFVAAAVMLVFGLLLLGLHRSYNGAVAETNRHGAGLNAIGELYLSVRDAETNQRGYLLTGDSTFLQDFEAAFADAEARLIDLPAYAATPAESAAVAQLGGLVRLRLDASRDVLAVARQAGRQVAAGAIAQGEGRRAMAQLRETIAGARTGVAQVQEARLAHLRERYLQLIWFIGGGTGLAALAGLLTGTGLARYARERDRAVVMLENANAHLRQQAEELEAQALELELQTQELEESGRELAARGEHFQALVEEAADMILELGADGRVRYASPGALRVLGRGPSALAGHALADFFHPDGRADAEALLQRLLDGQQREVRLDWRLQAADGTWRRVEGRARNLLDRAAVGCIVINCRDVTQQRDVEAQLRQAQKMEAVGQLAGGVAHDFNNLLTTIRGYASFAADSTPEDSPARDDLHEVIRAADLAASLTRQLLTFSRKQVTNPEVLDLNEVLQDSGGMLRRLLGTSIDMVTRPDPSVGRVLIDDGQIRQVIMNLAVNARDAMPEGGRLVIETSAVEVDAEHAERRGVEPGAYTVLSVTDNGDGIPADVQEHIFEPFFTTKEQGRGTGLGLSTAYGIVRQAGGYIWVYSEPGNGATFKVYLPAVESPGTVDAAPREADALRGTGDELLLLVEDDAAVRAFAERALVTAGHRVISAATGADALQVLESGEPVALVITDVIMPGMSGAALGREVERLYPGTRLLYTSGYPRNEMSWRGSIPANVEFVAKPYSSGDLLRAVARLLDGRSPTSV